MTIIFFEFDTPVNIPSSLDEVKIQFNFSFIDSEYRGTPRENSETKQNKITIQASRSLLDTWRLEDESIIEKVLFQIAKKKISFICGNNGNLLEEIQYKVNTTTHPNGCPYDIKSIESPANAIFQLKVKRSIGFI